MRLLTGKTNRSRPIDHAEPGQKIADVLPSDLDLRREGTRNTPDEGFQKTPCCGTKIHTTELYNQHVDRAERTGVCLGHVPEGGLTTLERRGELLVIVNSPAPADVDNEIDADTDALLDEVLSAWKPEPQEASP